MDKKTIVSALIAVVVIVAIVAVALHFASGDKEEPLPTVEKGPYTMNDMTLPADIRLVVCGNANNDDVIDKADLQMIQDIVSGKAQWDKDANPLADAYPDGVIDQKDIDLMLNILAKSDCYVYYVDYQGQTVRVQYPITGTVGTMYYQQAQLAQLFGIWDDRVIACGSTSMSEISNPGWSNLISYGPGYNVDPETVVKSDVDTIICYTQTDTTAPGLKDLVAKTDIDLNVLCVNHEQLARCVATYGFLFDLEDISGSYLNYADECNESLYDCLVEVPKEEQPSVAIVMLYGTATTDSIRVLGYSETGNKHNLGVLMNSIPNANWIRADSGTGSYGTYVTSEWFVNNNPDYIVLVGSGIGTTDDMNLDQVKQVYYNKCKEVFGETNAFLNGNIVCTSNGVLNGYSNQLISLKLLSYVYPQIDQELADEAYNAWYDDYTCFSVDQKPTEAIFTVGGA